VNQVAWYLSFLKNACPVGANVIQRKMSSFGRLETVDFKLERHANQSFALI
jgi:hypothetical protein